MSIAVPFEESKVKEYLDSCIVLWRKHRESGGPISAMAVYYIDAFQSVRTSLFDELLPESPVKIGVGS